MKAQIVERAVKMQEALDDYNALKALRKAKADPKNLSGRPFDEVVEELGLVRKSR